CTSDIYNLEWEIADLEARIDSGYEEWEERSIAKAHEIVSQARADGILPTEDADLDEMLSPAALRVLSPEVKVMLQTTIQLTRVYASDKYLGERDHSPLIAEMSKICERIFAEFFSARLQNILQDQSVSALAKDFNLAKQHIKIPNVDRQANVNNGSLKKILETIGKPVQKWSGTRNCGIAVLLFGTRFSVGLAGVSDIVNPLGLTGTEQHIEDLRVLCYQLQDRRNDFVHHDPADVNDLRNFYGLFHGCLTAMVRVFYGI